LILHAATWCHGASATHAAGSPVAAMRTLIPAESRDVGLGQSRCKIPPFRFATYHHGRAGDGRHATDWEFAEQVRRVQMSTKGDYEHDEHRDHHFS
jgi:hypothetical protein